MHPKCFNSLNEYAQWQAFNRISGDKVSICTDCTFEYQQRMKREARCEMIVQKKAVIEEAKCLYCGADLTGRRARFCSGGCAVKYQKFERLAA